MDDLEQLRQMLADLQAQEPGHGKDTDATDAEAAEKRWHGPPPVNERNAVELVLKLTGQGRTDLVFAEDGQTYITRAQLARDVLAALAAAGGRIPLAEAAERLGVAPAVARSAAETLARAQPPPLLLADGGAVLVAPAYVARAAHEVAELVAAAARGTLPVADVAARLGLDAPFVLAHVLAAPALRGALHVDAARGVLASAAHARWLRARVRGLLRAATRPLALAPLAARTGLAPDALAAAAADLVRTRAVHGTLTGASGAGAGATAVFVPACYTAARAAWAQAFYAQNGFVAYGALADAGVDAPEAFARALVPAPLGLATLALSPRTVAVARAALAAALEDDGVADLAALLPPALTPRDVRLAARAVLADSDETAGDATAGEAATRDVLTGARLVGDRFVVGAHMGARARAALDTALATPRLAARLCAACPSESTPSRHAKGGARSSSKKGHGRRGGTGGGDDESNGNDGDDREEQFVAALAAVLRETLEGEDGAGVAVADEVLATLAHDLAGTAIAACAERQRARAEEAAAASLARAQEHTEALTAAYLDACLGAAALQRVAGTVRPADRTALERHVLHTLVAPLLAHLAAVEAALCGTASESDEGNKSAGEDDALARVGAQLAALERASNNRTRTAALQRLHALAAGPKGTGNPAFFGTAPAPQRASTKGHSNSSSSKKGKGKRRRGAESDSDSDGEHEETNSEEAPCTAFLDGVCEYARGAVGVRLPTPESRAVAERLAVHAQGLARAVAAPGLAPPQALHLAALALHTHAQHCWLPAPPRLVHVLLDPARLALAHADAAAFVAQYHRDVVLFLRAPPADPAAAAAAQHALADGVARLQAIVAAELSTPRPVAAPATADRKRR